MYIYANTYFVVTGTFTEMQIYVMTAMMINFAIFSQLIICTVSFIYSMQCVLCIMKKVFFVKACHGASIHVCTSKLNKTLK
jgi:hypothetical protein